MLRIYLIKSVITYVISKWKTKRKRDRVLNVFKAGAKRTHKGFQKIQPVLNKVKPIVNPRNALLGFLVMSVLSPSAANYLVGLEI